MEANLNGDGDGRLGLILAVSSSVGITVLTWKVLQWRAEIIAAEHAKVMIRDGPLIDCFDSRARRQILDSALKRALKCVTFGNILEARPLRGQVGGLSSQKHPILTLDCGFILKPLRSDDRAIREVAFYEALQLLPFKRMASASHLTPYSSGLAALVNKLVADGIAVWLGLTQNDSIVEQYESREKEIELLRTLSTFTAPYYGVMRRSPTSPTSALRSESYLLLSDITSDFTKPCVIDIKMGQQTYEPDAPAEKCAREFDKYTQQSTFGFRIVGMIIYRPNHPDSDSMGFCRFDKFFGRSLDTRHRVENAFRTFFSVTKKDENGPTKKEMMILRRRVIKNLIAHLKVVKHWFDRDNTLFAFYASSILMVYEGDDLNGTAKNCDDVRLKMIDFSHVRRQHGGDSGYIHGLQNIIQIFNDVLLDTRSF